MVTDAMHRASMMYASSVPWSIPSSVIEGLLRAAFEEFQRGGSSNATPAANTNAVSNLAPVPLGAAIAPEHDEALAQMAEEAERRFLQDTKDAERYRWLRDPKRIPKNGNDTDGDGDGHILVCDHSGEDVLWLSQLDRAIDAAIAASKGGAA